MGSTAEVCEALGLQPDRIMLGNISLDEEKHR